MEMKTKPIIGILICLLLFPGCLQPTERDLTESEASICGNATGNIRDECYSELAEKNLHPSLCNGVNELASRDHCFERLATLLNRPELCEEAGDHREFCYADLGANRNDTSLCNKITDSNAIQVKASCYSQVARNTDNISLCDEIYNGPDKHNCYEGIAKKRNDSAICSLITEQYPGDLGKDDCFVSFAVTNQDISECSKVSNPDRINQCNAKLSQNPLICGSITDEQDRSHCYHEFANARNDSSICDKISDSFSKDVCYMQIADNKNNLSLCNKVNRTDLRIICKSEVYLNLASCDLIDESSCDEVSGSYKRYCYDEVSRCKRYCYDNGIYAANNASYCDESFKNDEKKKQCCYTSISITNQNISLCEKVTDPDYQILCQAVIKKDSSQCPNLKDDGHIKLCYNPEIYGLSCS
jgi:hypothetical protein